MDKQKENLDEIFKIIFERERTAYSNMKLDLSDCGLLQLQDFTEKEMDKQIIEEIVITAYPIYATMEDSLRKEAIECMNSYTVFERLYEAGYRKIPENAVVISREEYEKFKKQDLFMKDYTIVEVLENETKKVRKETAEKFAEMAKAKKKYITSKSYNTCEVVFIKDVDEICNELQGE